MSKKTETIEVRLSPELKARLSDACKHRDQPMSRLIRQLVEAELSDFALETTQSGVDKLAKSGTRKLREFGFAGVSLVALALGWTLATQTPVSAQMAVRVTFAEMDRNEDGIITRDEYRRFLTHDFTAADEKAVNIGDDKVPAACEADFAALEDQDISRIVTEDFTEYDSDKDGQLVYDEVRAAMIQERAEEFAELDRNADGVLIRAELDTLLSEPPEEDDELSAGCLQALKLLESATPQEDADELRLAFAAMDENRDNRISREEYLNN